MTGATLIPAENQVQLMLESPMTDTELSQLEQIEQRSTSAAGKITLNKIEMAQCLYEVYQYKLFRGERGGRTWGDYLKSHRFGKLGFPNELETNSANDWLMFAALCDAIDDWCDQNPGKERLPYPPGATYVHGWSCLFNRKRAAGAANYLPFLSADDALETWKTAVFANDGKAPSRSVSRNYGSKAVAMGIGREPQSPNGLAKLEAARGQKLTGPGPSGSTPEPEFKQPTASAADRMQAAADAAAREQRQATARAEERSLREDGIDPRSVSVMEKESDFDVMNECETYSTQMNKVHFEVQTLEVWVRGRLNQYGTDGMDMLRQFDAGIYSINDDIGTITDLSQRLADLAALLQDSVEPGSLHEGKFQAEPSA